MIIVTGGAGFIGSNIVKALNDKGITDILVVDNLKDGTKFVNLVDLNIADYMDKEDFLIQIMAGEEFGDVEAIFHEGACSSRCTAFLPFSAADKYSSSGMAVRTDMCCATSTICLCRMNAPNAIWRR